MGNVIPSIDTSRIPHSYSTTMLIAELTDAVLIISPEREFCQAIWLEKPFIHLIDIILVVERRMK